MKLTVGKVHDGRVFCPSTTRKAGLAVDHLRGMYRKYISDNQLRQSLENSETVQ